MDKILGKWLLPNLVGVLFAIILVLSWMQVFRRYVIANPATWTEEISRLLLVWATFIAAAVAVYQDDLMRIDIFTSRLSPKASAIFNVIIGILVFFVGFVLLWYGGQFYQYSAGDFSTSLGYPRNLFYLPVPVGGGLMCFFSTTNILRQFRFLRQRKEF
ncbi:MAG: TRAP transporter small permease [Desulfobacterium sp.]